MPSTATPTPGARVVIRDAEWIVRRVDHSSAGGYQIVCDGVSELVRGREAVFLTALEQSIEVLDPAKTKLVPDTSPQFSDSLLYMESQLLHGEPASPGRAQRRPHPRRPHGRNGPGSLSVIDEAHNVADRGTRSLRNRLAKRLSGRSDTLIMLSATPHDGKARSFASLVNMLDATAIADPDRYSKEDFRPGLVIRRFKKDVQDQVRDAFRDREVFTRPFPGQQGRRGGLRSVAGGSHVHQRRNQVPPRVVPRHAGEGALLKPGCLRRDHRSAPQAPRARDRRRPQRRLIGARGRRPSPSAGGRRPDRTPAYAKYDALLAAIRDGQPFDWRPTDPEDRLVVFTERIATLDWLKTRLQEDLELKPNQIETLHGGMSDVDQQRIVEDFGNARRPVRVLLCSDVASEGINLHHQCHRLIHFDLPWSLMVFQQRNGRVDRYGQNATPQIVYLVAESSNPTVRGDTRILEVLVAKDEQAYRNIGDPSVFMDVRDVDEEERITQAAIADGETAEHFDERLTPTANEGEDLLSMFLQPGTVTSAQQPPAAPPPPLSLFPSELDYCDAALHRLRARGADRLRFSVDGEARTLTLDAPEDLTARYGYLPPEVLPDSRRFVLTTDRRRMSEAIAESRRAESEWPSLHYLWRLSPVVGWLNDRMLAAFGRFEAPVLAGVPGLEENESVFVFSGLVPNQKSHPLVYEWIAIPFLDGAPAEPVTFEALMDRTGLGGQSLANRQQPVDLARISHQVALT